MKSNIRMFIMLLLCTSFTLATYGQTPQKNPTITNPKNAGNAKALGPQDFINSVVLAQDFTNFKGKPRGYKAPITIQIYNFDPSKKLLPVYTFDGVTYNDDGKYNDKVAGDGIFTSTASVKVSSSSALPNTRYVAGDSFKYKQAFDNYMNQGPAQGKSGPGLSCKIRIVTCPETNWWNSCWPFSSPCYCVEFYDCEFSIGINL